MALPPDAVAEEGDGAQHHRPDGARRAAGHQAEEDQRRRDDHEGPHAPPPQEEEQDAQEEGHVQAGDDHHVAQSGPVEDVPVPLVQTVAVAGEERVEEAHRALGIEPVDLVADRLCQIGGHVAQRHAVGGGMEHAVFVLDRPAQLDAAGDVQQAVLPPHGAGGGALGAADEPVAGAQVQAIIAAVQQALDRPAARCADADGDARAVVGRIRPAADLRLHLSGPAVQQGDRALEERAVGGQPQQRQSDAERDPPGPLSAPPQEEHEPDGRGGQPQRDRRRRAPGQIGPQRRRPGEAGREQDERHRCRAGSWVGSTVRWGTISQHLFTDLHVPSQGAVSSYGAADQPGGQVMSRPPRTWKCRWKTL